MSDVTDILIKQIEGVIDGSVSLPQAKTVCKLGAQIVYKERLEMEASVLEANKKRWFGDE